MPELPKFKKLPPPARVEKKEDRKTVPPKKDQPASTDQSVVTEETITETNNTVEPINQETTIQPETNQDVTPNVTENPIITTTSEPVTTPVVGSGMESKISEQFSDELIAERQEPFTEEVATKDHNRPDYTNVDTQTPIAEPTFRRPQLNVEQIKSDMGGSSTPSGPTGPSKTEVKADQKQQWAQAEKKATEDFKEVKAGDGPVNASFATMSDKEKEEGGEWTARQIIDGYEWAWQQIGNVVKTSDQKIIKLQNEDEQDFTLPVMIKGEGADKVVSLYEYLQSVNKDVDKVVKVSEAFRNDVKGPLEEELKKRGAVASPWQRLLFSVAKDSGAKLVGIGQIYMGIQNILTQMGEIHEQNKQVIKHISEKGLTPEYIQQMMVTNPAMVERLFTNMERMNRNKDFFTQGQQHTASANVAPPPHYEQTTTTTTTISNDPPEAQAEEVVK